MRWSLLGRGFGTRGIVRLVHDEQPCTRGDGPLEPLHIDGRNRRPSRNRCMAPAARRSTRSGTSTWGSPGSGRAPRRRDPSGARVNLPMTGLPPGCTAHVVGAVGDAAGGRPRRPRAPRAAGAMPALGQYVVLPSRMALVVASAMLAGGGDVEVAQMERVDASGPGRPAPRPRPRRANTVSVPRSSRRVSAQAGSLREVGAGLQPREPSGHTGASRVTRRRQPRKRSCSPSSMR